MWVSDKWQEYQLIDCSGGERLERWGDRILIRPDPQVIWNTPRTNPLWDRADGHYVRSSSGGGRWVTRALPDAWTVRYEDLAFQVRPMNFKHTGLFPEQAVNWEYMADRIRQADRPVQVLNLFGYTGAATLACAKAGAAVCHVDAARGMVSWGRENAAASGAVACPVRWIVEDCARFVAREIRRGRRYDAIVMDPPSYGRGPKGETWKLEHDLWDFVNLCAEVLSDAPLFVLLNSYTTGLSPAAMGYVMERVFADRFGGGCVWDELGLPVAESGGVLPCGATCRWTPDGPSRSVRRGEAQSCG